MDLSQLQLDNRQDGLTEMTPAQQPRKAFDLHNFDLKPKS
jgi:hypothetical protein